MLNPSTADAVLDDATIRRCINLARSWNYGALEVVNLFAYRTTHPKELRKVANPIGADNDRYLASLGDRVETILLAWGNWGSLHNRCQAAMPLLGRSSRLHCLGLTQQGQPRHPLYLPRNSTPIVFSSTDPVSD